MRTRSASLALGVLGVGAWLASSRSVRNAIERDPAHESLATVLEGETRTVRSADGTQLHVEEFGPHDGQTLVLAHGWTCNLRFWTCQIQALAPELRIVAYDLRGHGESGRASNNDYSMDAHADDLQAVLEACVPADQRALVAGHSLGAMTVVAWAGRYPDLVGSRLSGAALINTGVGDLISASLIAPMPTRLQPISHAISERVIGSSLPLPRRSSPMTHGIMRYAALSGAATPAQVAYCDALAATSRRDVRGACGRTLTRVNLYTAIPHLTVPTVVIAGGRDRLSPLVHSERLVKDLPSVASYVVVPHAGHMVPITDAEIVARELRALVVAPELVSS